MRTYQDAKVMAKALRSSLSARQIDIPHSAALEIVAAQFGFENWNVLAAKLDEPKSTGGIRFERTCPIMRIFRCAEGQGLLSRLPGF